MEADKDLFWIAKQGLQSPMPPHWEAVTDREGGTYYYNLANHKVQHEHPLDEQVKQKYREEKAKKV